MATGKMPEGDIVVPAGDWTSEDIGNPAYSKKLPMKIKDQRELIKRKDSDVLDNMHTIGSIAYGVARLHPATALLTDVIDFAYNSGADQGVPGTAIGKAADYVGGLKAYDSLTKPSGDVIKDWVGNTLKPKAEAGRSLVLDRHTAPINNGIKNVTKGMRVAGKAFRVGDIAMDSSSLLQDLKDVWKHGKVLTDEERSAKKDSTDYKAQ